jgi:formate-dependent nitrite reductase membrane component NrfD
VSADDERRGWLERDGDPPEVEPSEEPPSSSAGREAEWVADHDPQTRDITPALGSRGGPGSWRRAREDAPVALARSNFGDAQWSFLYKARDTRYAGEPPADGEIAAANRRMRSATVAEVHGPFIKAPVWTWEVPLYFWVGGVASGAAFVASACDVSGDHHSAVIARRVALGAVAPAPVLLIADLGRSDRFLNMLRIFKPRSPMNLGAWCLVGFSGALGGAVGADLLGMNRAARWLGALTSLFGGYLGSYTGVLLASTAVPVWARSRLLLGPIFVSTATATGAAACRLTLVGVGLPFEHPTARALRRLETAAIISELSLSTLNERRLGSHARALHSGRPGVAYRVAQAAVITGLGAQLASRRRRARLQDLGSVLYLAGGLAFRIAWVQAGRVSARDDEAVAAMARGPRSAAREVSTQRTPVPLGGLRRIWGEAVRRTSLAVEQALRSRT